MKRETSMSKWTIYALIDPRNGQVFYVGKSSNIKVRATQHVSNAKTSRTHIRRTLKDQYILDMLDDGAKPEVLILESVSRGSSDVLELEWALVFRSLGHPLTNRLTHMVKDKLPLVKSVLGDTGVYI